MSRLPIKIRTVISLRFVHDLSTTEIAELLSIPQGTLKSRQYKGLKLLRSQLERAGQQTEPVKGGHYEYQPHKG
ncbi:RNA polymerase sigma factor [Saccharibacillus endophyticus]|uniref:RNA polymerase sigma factor n=1 Tax=Saccharibacillus endophyticus TaxID=2060666 RepID=UPI00280ABD18|nr:sigma factor-like helix-turn-helix DNA-binding protein [Saccharibacillus endophyticus]